ncbi:DNA helicase [Catellatospora sp. TT07R-123]|uniref:UvrD-helicase domain-containing protein n=1 Tax=Catellatospora sp. TT07R-123 TaxID=2733863 RepID=UPI001B2A0F56|nr:UvrD-helicase domain-containing protein [Catellatospora sp. TT07R-123]GHJ47254.1 DNA helicase [Catellatospora sp. TT07R-123]
MAKLALAVEFLAAYAKLQPPVRRAVETVFAKFAQHTHAGLHLEKLTGARDPNIRTIRVNDSYRGVVLALGDDQYVWYDVKPHDDAITYATTRVFSVNQVLGVLEVRDQSGLEAFDQAHPPTRSGLFEHVKTDELVRLGVAKELVPTIRKIETYEELDSLATFLPSLQCDVLNGLASGMSVHEVYEELSARILAADINPDDLLAAARRTPERIAFVTGPVELEAILAHPFDAWRTFLHPTQHDIAYRPEYSGSLLVTGGAGTGKTVTGMHRAVFLASRLPDDGTRVLLTTYTRALADALADQLRRLTDDPAVLNRIEVISVDRLARRIVNSRRGGKQLKIAENADLRTLWTEAAALGPSFVNHVGTVTAFSPAFLEREWEQVVLAQRLDDVDQYLAAPRRGRGDALRATQRQQVWAAIQHVTAQLSRRRECTYLQLADEASRIAEQQPPAYRHVIVDEGQDLHPAQWRLLRALVAPGPDDMFLLADPHQRIYDSQVSLAGLGIDVRGRSRRLTINYRTTHEILRMSVGVLKGTTAVGLDGEADSLRGYRSLTNGHTPRLTGHTDRDAEFHALIERVGTWLEQGVEAGAIGVAARTGQLVKKITAVLREAHIDVHDEQRAVQGVRVDTMHGMKGLEFQCLAVVGLDDAVLPAPHAVISAAEDPHGHLQDMQRERCLVFVALTRARDMLYLSHSGQPSTLLRGAA